VKAVALTRFLPIDDPHSLRNAQTHQRGQSAQVHAMLESGKAISKITLEEW
jgi:hypothetical protein